MKTELTDEQSKPGTDLKFRHFGNSILPWRPATNDPADIAVHIARNFEFELSPEEVHDHVTKVLLADQAREQLRDDGVLTEGRWFPLYHDRRDAKTALPPVLQVHDAEAAKRLRQAGFTVERTRATSTWIITDGPR